MFICSTLLSGESKRFMLSQNLNLFIEISAYFERQ